MISSEGNLSTIEKHAWVRNPRGWRQKSLLNYVWRREKSIFQLCVKTRKSLNSGTERLAANNFANVKRRCGCLHSMWEHLTNSHLDGTVSHWATETGEWDDHSIPWIAHPEHEQSQKISTTSYATNVIRHAANFEKHHKPLLTEYQTKVLKLRPTKLQCHSAWKNNYSSTRPNGAKGPSFSCKFKPITDRLGRVSHV